ncbi:MULTISPECIES: hypothetical protein [unclassified Wolbachia]|uniref:hypothetical protein n=2 Tax=Wolbachia TaxID=953 RepID=UPI0030CA228A
MDAIKNDGDVAGILQGASKDDFLNVFREKQHGSSNALLGEFEDEGEALKVVFNVAKEKNVLKEIVTDEICSVIYNSTEIYASLIDLIMAPNSPCIRYLNVIEESCGLEAFWKVISKDDRGHIKDALGRVKNQNMLDKICQVEKSMSKAVKENSPSNGSATQPLKNEAKTKQATSKAMITGGVCGVIAALAVIGGCFAFGVQLPMLALIGIAVAAALVVGIVAGVITYAISEPSNKLDEPDSNKVASDLTQKK